MANQKHSKRYNDDFRKMVVDLYRYGQSVKVSSDEYGVSEVTIYTWIKKLTPVELEDGSSVTPDDYAKMQKEMLKLQQKNEIFKSYGHIRKKINDNDITDLIDQKKNIILFTLCVSRSTYYQSLRLLSQNENKETNN